MKRNDWILLSSVLLVAIVALLVLYAALGGTGETVVVTVDGDEVLRVPLKKDSEHLIEGYNGGTNLLVIKDGCARIEEASCPDLVCVHTGEADELKSIVCAPNRVVVRIDSE